MAARQQEIAVRALLREWGNDPDLQSRITPRSGERFGRQLDGGRTVLITRKEYEALRDQGFIRILPGTDALELGARFKLTEKGRETLPGETAPVGSGPEPSGQEKRDARCSAIMTAGRLVFARINVGDIDTSQTCRPSIPCTLPSASTTARGSLAGPIRQLHAGW